MLLNAQPTASPMVSHSAPCTPVLPQGTPSKTTGGTLSVNHLLNRHSEMNRSRKGIPIRSLSIHDDQPGVTFKINHREKTFSINRIITAHGQAAGYTSSTIAFGFTTGSTAVPPLMGGPRTRSRSVSVKSSHQAPSWLFGDLQAATAQSFKRPRSNSLGMEDEGHAHGQIDVISQGGGEMSDPDIPFQHIPSGQRARKSSMTVETPSLPSSFCQITPYYPTASSAPHLIPNRVLNNLSRRISVHLPHDACHCASCKCTLTPYWRDGWSPEVMLCNACGLRYQKFARRCPTCVYIPRKEDSLGDNCIKCGTPWVVGLSQP